MKIAVLAFALIGLVLSAPAQLSDAVQLLEGSAHKYQQIGSYQASATAERPLDGQVTERIPLMFSYASARMTPPDLPVPMMPQAILEMRPKVIDHQGQAVDLAPPSAGPGPPFLQFDQIAWRVVSARITGTETVRAHPCEIVEVQYEGKSRNPAGEPVRYWIEATNGTIWKMQFSEQDREQPASSPTRWTIVWDSWIEDQPPPGWALQGIKSLVTAERPALIGHQAPEIQGNYLDGESFSLSKLKGYVVVLDFWATWCGPCAEEMASLEQLKKLLSEKKVKIVSVTEDNPVKAKRWVAERKRNLPVAIVPPNTAFSSYGIDELPQLVVIDQNGIVAHHWAGMKSERDLRTEIESLLAAGH